MGNDSCVADGRKDHRSAVVVSDADSYHSHYEGVSSHEEGHDNHDSHHPWEGMDRHVHHEVAIEIVDGGILERKARQVEAMKRQPEYIRMRMGKSNVRRLRSGRRIL